MHGTFQLWRLESTLKVEVRKTNWEPGEVLPRECYYCQHSNRNLFLRHKLGENVSELYIIFRLYKGLVPTEGNSNRPGEGHKGNFEILKILQGKQEIKTSFSFHKSVKCNRDDSWGFPAGGWASHSLVTTRETYSVTYLLHTHSLLQSIWIKAMRVSLKH